MQPADLSIVSEIEAAINATSAEKGLQTIRRVTDLFLLSADRFDDEQVALFDNVLDRLVKSIELRAMRGCQRPRRACGIEQPACSHPPGAAVRDPSPRAKRRDHDLRARPVGIRTAERGRTDRTRADQAAAASAGHRRPLVVEGRRHRRVAGPAIPRRQPPRRRQSRCADFRGRICLDSWRRRKAIRTSPSKQASGPICPRNCATSWSRRRRRRCELASWRARRPISSRISAARSWPRPPGSTARCPRCTTLPRRRTS